MLQKIRQGLCVLLVCCMLLALVPAGAVSVVPMTAVGATPPAAIRDIFPDPVLAEQLLLHEQPSTWTLDTVVTQEDLDSITWVWALDSSVLGASIVSLQGLQYLRNLEYLDLFDHAISDLTPLAGLVNLNNLHLNTNQISDLTPLEGLTSLESLTLGNNQINNLTPLEGLVNLEALSLDRNQIDDSILLSLSALTNLKSLGLHDNQISDLAPLAELTDLQTLLLDRNQISSLAPLATLTSLQALGLGDNQISDLTPLAELTNLQLLWLDNNQISDLSPLFSLRGSLELLSAQGQFITLDPITLPPGTQAQITVENRVVNMDNIRVAPDGISGPSTYSSPYIKWEGLSSDAYEVWYTFDGDVSGTLAIGGRFSGTVTQPLLRTLPFTDVTDSNWFYPYVRYVFTNNVMHGTDATTFSPSMHFSRAQIVATLYRAVYGGPASEIPYAGNRSVFTDVEADAWYSPYIIWAYDHGIVLGVGDDRFAPSRNVTREQIAAMLHRFAGVMGYDTTVTESDQWSAFTDLDEIAPWDGFEEALLWANNLELITGRTPTTIVPGGTAMRSEAAAILTRLMETFYMRGKG